MSDECKKELMLAARTGDYKAINQLLHSGVEPEEIFPQKDKERNTIINNNNKYIYIVQRDDDEGSLQLVSLDFKTAFEYADNYRYCFTVWIDGDDDYLIQENIYSDLTNVIKVFKNTCNGECEDLLEIALPILEFKQNEYETKQQQLLEQEEARKREKELVQLARLKAKYES